MRSCLNPFARLRRSLGPVAATLLLFFGVAQVVAAWHVARGADQDRVSVAAADQSAPSNGGHVDDGCALCSTPVQPTFAAVLIAIVVETAPRRMVPLEPTLLPASPIVLGASGPRAPPAVS